LTRSLVSAGLIGSALLLVNEAKNGGGGGGGDTDDVEGTTTEVEVMETVTIE